MTEKDKKLFDENCGDDSMDDSKPELPRSSADSESVAQEPSANREMVTCGTSHSESVPPTIDELSSQYEINEILNSMTEDEKLYNFQATDTANVVPQLPENLVEASISEMKDDKVVSRKRIYGKETHLMGDGASACKSRRSKRMKARARYDIRLGPGESSALGVSSQLVDNTVTKDEFLKLQEVRNILKAAYVELMMKAFQAGTWASGIPALGSIEELIALFHGPAPDGMRLECSTECAILPTVPNDLIPHIMNQAKWRDAKPPASILSICKHGDAGIREIAAGTDELVLPTPWAPLQKYQFLRFLKEIIPDIWAIIDISIDYFQDTSSSSSAGSSFRKRPSGIIFRRHGCSSEVIWIENVEVKEPQVQHNLFSPTFSSNWEFCAKRRVTALSHYLTRATSIFTTCKMRLPQDASFLLLELSEFMLELYLSPLTEAPNKDLWDIISNQEVRVMRYKTRDPAALQEVHTFVALTTFGVLAKPISVFSYLTEKNMELLWPTLSVQEPEEIIKLVTEDNSNCITLHTDKERRGFLFQEASRIEFCSFITATPMNAQDVYYYFCNESGGDSHTYQPIPSGFAIMSDGSGGLHSHASVVTISTQCHLPFQEADKAIRHLTDKIRTISSKIKEALTSGEDETS